MLQNRERIERRAGETVRREEGIGGDGRSGRRPGRTPRRAAALAAVVGLAVAGLAVAGLSACGADSTERARAEGDGGSGSVESVARAARPESSAVVQVSETRPAGEPVMEPVTSPVDSSPPANVSYEDAESVFRAGEYAEAADLFEAYTVRRPENPWGHYMVGISAWRAGDHERAEAALRRTIEVRPQHVKGLLNLARVLLDERKASDALEYVERVVDLKPQAGEGWRVLGNARAELGMTEEAIEAYREALVLDERDAWTMNNLGLLMIREGRYEEALPPLARAATLRPDAAVFQNNLGIALERTGHIAEAAEAFRAALLADAEHEKARVSLERVEARVPATVAEPLDLAGPASDFADEVARWKERGLGAETPESAAMPETGATPGAVDTTGHGG